MDCTVPYASVESPRLTISVDQETEESWADVLSQFRDATIYQTWAYGAARWGEKNLSHFTVRLGSTPVVAAQLRIIKSPYVPFGVAYLRWGPLCRPGEGKDPASNMRDALEALKQEYWSRRRLLLQVVPHVFCSTEDGEIFRKAVEAAGFKPVESASSYKTIRVDLGASPDQLRRSLDQKWRNQLNRAEKNQLEVVIRHDSGAYDEFTAIYRGMWERKRFETSVDVEEFARIQKLLPEASKMRVFLARHEGRAIAAVVCSAMGDTGIYLLGATDEKARELKAAYVLQWQAMLWLKENGTRWYDLGGIDRSANPGGHHFKSGMGGNEFTALANQQYCGNGLLTGIARLALKARKLKNIRQLG